MGARFKNIGKQQVRLTSFEGNAAFYGGGAVYSEGHGKNVSLCFDDCTFANNVSGASDYSQGGGAIFTTETEITELTPEIVREFIEKITVHQAERVDGKKSQAVEIIYNGIGVIPTLIP